MTSFTLTKGEYYAAAKMTGVDVFSLWKLTVSTAVPGVQRTGGVEEGAVTASDMLRHIGVVVKSDTQRVEEVSSGSIGHLHGVSVGMILVETTVADAPQRICQVTFCRQAGTAKSSGWAIESRYLRQDKPMSAAARAILVGVFNARPMRDPAAAWTYLSEQPGFEDEANTMPSHSQVASLWSTLAADAKRVKAVQLAATKAAAIVGNDGRGGGRGRGRGRGVGRGRGLAAGRGRDGGDGPVELQGAAAAVERDDPTDVDDPDADDDGAYFYEQQGLAEAAHDDSDKPDDEVEMQEGNGVDNEDEE